MVAALLNGAGGDEVSVLAWYEQSDMIQRWANKSKLYCQIMKWIEPKENNNLVVPLRKNLVGKGKVSFAESVSFYTVPISGITLLSFPGHGLAIQHEQKTQNSASNSFYFLNYSDYRSKYIRCDCILFLIVFLRIIWLQVSKYCISWWPMSRHKKYSFNKTLSNLMPLVFFC